MWRGNGRAKPPSPALVLSLIALFVSLGGTGYAAIKITGKDVADSSLTGSDVKNESLTRKDVKGLGTRDIVDASLLAKDFKTGELPAGPKGEIGATGPAGVKGETGATGPPGPGSRLTTLLTPGSTTYTAPANTARLLVRLWGGGGGGGEGNNWGGGGGGGQGGYAEALVPASPGATFNVLVGAGGAGALAGVSDPTAGGNTTFASGANTLLTANGGAFGGNTSSCPNSGQPGGAGGRGSVTAPAQGTLAIPGVNGTGGQSAPGCGGGSGAGGDGGGVPGFRGSGGDSLDAGIFGIPSGSGSAGAAVIVSYAD